MTGALPRREALRRRPALAFPVPPFVFSAAYACIPIADPIGSSSLAITPHSSKDRTMTLTFSKLGKSGKVAFYTGAAITLSIGVSAFPGKTAPSTIEVADGVFAAKVVKEAKVKETKEARKARLAALPKKTAAQKLADLETKAAALRAKLAEEQPVAM